MHHTKANSPQKSSLLSRRRRHSIIQIITIITISSLLLFLPIGTIRTTSAFGIIARRAAAVNHAVPSSSLSFTARKMASTPADAEGSSSSSNPLERLGLPSPILLGSASFTRKLILKEMGIPFLKVVRPIDEKALGDRSQDLPADLVLTLAKAKMDHLVQEIQAGRCQEDLMTGDGPDSNNEEWIVLTGDQVVTCDGAILEKPESIEEARSFVAKYRTHPPSTVGSCVLTHLPSGIQVAGVDTATINFFPTIPVDLVDRLVELEEPILSCAGGLMIEHALTKEHLDRIDGTEDSVMGLSKDLVLRLLNELKEKLDDDEQKNKT